MPSKFRYFTADKDDLVWEKLDESVDEWEKSTRTPEACRAAGKFILEWKDGTPEQIHQPDKGGYNIVYRLEYKDGTSVIMRIPIKGIVPFPDEKVRYEAATMRYIAANTTIPVPHVYHYGTAAENPTGLGAFIIMDYINHYQNMSRELLDPNRPAEERPVLDPNIDQKKLELLYGQMANILLQLSNLRFPRIGSLVEEAGEFSIQGRPLTTNMGDIVVHTSAPAILLPSQPCASADSWYAALADMHMAQLSFQHNDAVDDEDDARDKYVARQLFRNLAAEGRLATDESAAEGDFRLFCEDFRPANVLLDRDLCIVSVIDWEFTYAAPAQFSFDPPWWLLLEEPDWYHDGYYGWMEACEPRFKTFLKVLEAEERKVAAANIVGKMSDLSLDGVGKAELSLSQRMRESWERRTWMVSYVARKSWALDFVWWKFLDERYFGLNEDQEHSKRLDSLSGPQRQAMDQFVEVKMEESKKREIVKWEDGDALARLAEALL